MISFLIDKWRTTPFLGMANTPHLNFKTSINQQSSVHLCHLFVLVCEL